jgi:hypothetical protein
MQYYCRKCDAVYPLGAKQHFGTYCLHAKGRQGKQFKQARSRCLHDVILHFGDGDSALLGDVSKIIQDYMASRSI